jgi:hypothetical protein
VPSDAGLGSEHPAMIYADSKVNFSVREVLVNHVFANTIYQHRSVDRISVTIGTLKDDHHSVANNSAYFPPESLGASGHSAHESGVEFGDCLSVVLQTELGRSAHIDVKHRCFDHFNGLKRSV